jgi:hypothetical protein
MWSSGTGSLPKNKLSLTDTTSSGAPLTIVFSLRTKLESLKLFPLVDELAAGESGRVKVDMMDDLYNYNIVVVVYYLAIATMLLLLALCEPLSLSLSLSRSLSRALSFSLCLCVCVCLSALAVL